MKLQLLLMARNFNRPPREILADLIAISTSYRVSLPHTTFGKARKLDQRPDISFDANTYIEAEFDEAYDASFPGANGFLYYRLPLSALVNGRTITVNSPQPFKTHDVLSQINAQLDSQLSRHDVVNQDWPGGSAVLVTLRAAEGSWVWTNDALPDFGALRLNLLNALILNGLTYTQPPVAPENLELAESPVITGLAQPGRFLTVSDGVWSGAEVLSYEYQWYKEGEPIEGRIGSSYGVPEDSAVVGNTITATVTAVTTSGLTAEGQAEPVVVEPAPPPADQSTPVFDGGFTGPAGPLENQEPALGGTWDWSDKREGYSLDGGGNAVLNIGPNPYSGGLLSSQPLTIGMVGWAMETTFEITDLTPNQNLDLRLFEDFYSPTNNEMHRLTFTVGGAFTHAGQRVIKPSNESTMVFSQPLPVAAAMLGLGVHTLRLEIMPGLYRAWVDGVMVDEKLGYLEVPTAPQVQINYAVPLGAASWKFKTLKLDGFQAADWTEPPALFEGEFKTTSSAPLLYTVYETAPGAAGIRLFKNGAEQLLASVTEGERHYVRFDGPVVLTDHLKITASDRAQVTELHAEDYNIHRTEPLPEGLFDGLLNLKVVRWRNSHVDTPFPRVTGIEKLEVLDCHHCNFTGELPELYELQSLTYLDLSFNKLTGFVPKVGFSQVVEVRATDNQFTAYDWSGWGNSLQLLDLSNNALSQYAIDSILDDLTYVPGSGVGKTAKLDGGTNAAPSAAGLTTKAALEANGWTIIVNQAA